MAAFDISKNFIVKVKYHYEKKQPTRNHIEMVAFLMFHEED